MSRAILLPVKHSSPSPFPVSCCGDLRLAHLDGCLAIRFQTVSVSPKNLFSFFLLAAAGGKEKKKEKLGTPQTPAGRTLHPFYDVFKWYWPQAADTSNEV